MGDYFRCINVCAKKQRNDTDPLFFKNLVTDVKLIRERIIVAMKGGHLQRGMHAVVRKEFFSKLNQLEDALHKKNVEAGVKMVGNARGRRC